MGFPQQTGYYVPALPQPQRFFNNPQVAMRAAQPRWPQQPRGAPQPQMMMPGQQNMRPRNPRMQMARPVAAPMMAPMGVPRPGMPPQGMPQAQPPQQPGGVRPNYKYTPGVRNAAGQVVPAAAAAVPAQAAMPPQQPQQAQPAVFIQGQEPLTASMLAAAQPNEQKQMLGERLFPLIQTMHPDLAGKITGMLLEIDNSELVHMLEDNSSLKSKVEEAVAVLQQHHKAQGGD